MAALWKSWGVSPDAVVGHSVGEIAALHVAGVLDLREAVRVVWHRGRIMQQATGLGRMASVGMTEAEASGTCGDLWRPARGRLPSMLRAASCFPGETAALEAALATLTASGVSHRMLPVQYAFHSAQMAPFQDQLVEQLGAVRAAPPTVAVYSTVTGGLAKDGASTRPISAAMCASRYGSPAAIHAMAEDGCDVFIEIGPQPVLASSIAECLASARARAGGFGIFAPRPAGARNACCRPVRLPMRPVAIWTGSTSSRASGQSCRAAGLSMAAKAPLDPSTPSAQCGFCRHAASNARASNPGGGDRGGDFRGKLRRSAGLARGPPHLWPAAVARRGGAGDFGGGCRNSARLAAECS